MKKLANLKSLPRKRLVKSIHIFAENFEEITKQRIIAALDLAQKIHRYQAKRPDGAYFNHVLRVAVRLICWGKRDPNMIMAALLHDSIEDQKYKLFEEFKLPSQVDKEKLLKKLGEKFGKKVAEYISQLTNPSWSKNDLPEKKNLLYYQHIKNIVDNNSPAAAIKLSDFFDNALGLRKIKDEKFREKLQLKYFLIFPLFIKALESKRIGIAQSKEFIKILEKENQYVDKYLNK